MIIGLRPASIHPILTTGVLGTDLTPIHRLLAFRIIRGLFAVHLLTPGEFGPAITGVLRGPTLLTSRQFRHSFT